MANKQSNVGAIFNDFICYFIPGVLLVSGLIVFTSVGSQAFDRLISGLRYYDWLVIPNMIVISYSLGSLLSLLRYRIFDHILDLILKPPLHRAISADRTLLIFRIFGHDHCLPEKVRTTINNSITTLFGDSKIGEDAAWHLANTELANKNPLYYYETYDRYVNLAVFRKNTTLATVLVTAFYVSQSQETAWVS